MTTVVCFERCGHRVAAHNATRIAKKMAALGSLVTGLESERCKQQRGSVYCSSRCRQRAYYRRTRGGWAAK